jgi:hypothetical protein
LFVSPANIGVKHQLRFVLPNIILLVGNLRDATGYSTKICKNII